MFGIYSNALLNAGDRRDSPQRVFIRGRREGFSTGKDSAVIATDIYRQMINTQQGADAIAFIPRGGGGVNKFLGKKSLTFDK